MRRVHAALPTAAHAGVGGRIVADACNDVTGNDTFLESRQRYDYDCGVYAHRRCAPLTYRHQPRVSSEAGEAVARTPLVMAASLADLAGQFSVTTGTGILVIRYTDHRSCRPVDAWSLNGAYREVSYRRSVQQQCYKVVIVMRPVAATWNYDPYPC